MIHVVAIYCRVSTSDQNCDRQVQELTAYAQKAGYQLAGIFKEVASGAQRDRAERKKVLALAQSRKIDAVLVSELTRWGRSTIDLIETLHLLQGWGVSLIAQSGWQVDLATPQGKLVANLMASLAEFERDLLRERVCSGLTSARARGKKLGRQPGQRVKADKVAAKVLKLVEEGHSYRAIARQLNLSPTTVLGIVRRSRMLDNKGPAP